MREYFRANVIKFFGALIYPSETLYWVSFLKTHRLLWELAKKYPCLSLKIYRPYLARHLSCLDRARILKKHYQLIMNTGFVDLVRRSSVTPVRLCEFYGKNSTRFELHWGGVSFGREGEVNLLLMSEGIRLYHASFVFDEQDGDSIIKLGCLQGIRSAQGAARVKAMTRDLYGCRPKNMMVAVIRDIGDYFGCKQLIMVSNKNRIQASKISRLHYKKISANYDETLLEMGAIKTQDDNYALPCTEILNVNFDNLPSKRRSETRKRIALLASLFKDVRHSLDACKSGSARSVTASHEQQPSTRIDPYPITIDSAILD